MRRMAVLRIGILLSVLLAVSVATTPAAAQSAHFEDVTVTLHPYRIDVELTGGELNGTEAADLRAYVDRQFGDNDGLLTDLEIAAYVADKKEADNERLAQFAPTLTRGLLIEGRQPTKVLITEITMTNMRGPVDSEDLITQAYDARLDFANHTKTRVNYTFSQDFRHALPGLSFTTATFTTTAPWAIDEASIRDGEGSTFYADGTYTVTYSEIPKFASADEPLWFDIIDTSAVDPKSEKKKGSPGPGAVLGVLAMLGAVLVARRQRGS